MDIIDHAQELDRLFQVKALHDFRIAQGKIKEILSVSLDGSRICLDCGDEIPHERIEANPLAVRCVDCQAKKERK